MELEYGSACDHRLSLTEVILHLQDVLDDIGDDVDVNELHVDTHHSLHGEWAWYLRVEA